MIFRLLKVCEALAIPYCAGRYQKQRTVSRWIARLSKLGEGDAREAEDGRRDERERDSSRTGSL